MVRLLSGIGQEDPESIEKVLRSTGFFYEYEISTALEIAEETLLKGHDKSGYFWLRAMDKERLVAFANYGKNSFSTHSWDLYWIAVDAEFRNKKLGTLLLEAVEENVRNEGGRILWIETSGRPMYKPTEEFYKRNGYTLAASLADFYGPGDPKQIYSKVL